jgi:glycerol 2-dehydrogenase (NADP+)
MPAPTQFKLNTGASIPAVGLGEIPIKCLSLLCPLSRMTDNILSGTWKAEPGEVRSAVAFALKDGYRHIDAALYEDSTRVPRACH